MGCWRCLAIWNDEGNNGTSYYNETVQEGDSTVREISGPVEIQTSHPSKILSSEMMRTAHTLSSTSTFSTRPRPVVGICTLRHTLNSDSESEANHQPPPSGHKSHPTPFCKCAMLLNWFQNYFHMATASKRVDIPKTNFLDALASL